MKVVALLCVFVAVLAVVGCIGGQAGPTATAYPMATPWPTATPFPTFTPRPTVMPYPDSTPYPTPTLRPALLTGDGLSLFEYADRFAGGPGAIYVGDLGQLAGPAVRAEFIDRYGVDLGDDYGNVPLAAIRQHQWIYESDYYQTLLVKAGLTNPTELVSRGESITLRHVCISRNLVCKHIEAYFVPNVRERTNGQVNIIITSFYELGASAFETMSLLADGVLPILEVHSDYMGSEFSKLATQYMWGLWPDHETNYLALTNLFDDIEKVIKDETSAQGLFRNWIAGHDRFFFSNRRLENIDDFQGLDIFSHISKIYYWLDYMGASTHFLSYEPYTSLERGLIDAAVSSANASLFRGWYKLTDYMNGPLYSFNFTTNAINKDVWDGIPADLQQILLEEGAKQELEALRLAAIHNLIGIARNVQAGLELVELGPEVRMQGFRAARGGMIPSWLESIGYPSIGQDAVDVFNGEIGPIVGLRIEPDGAVVTVPITMGPHAGRTMEQVLLE